MSDLQNSMLGKCLDAIRPSIFVEIKNVYPSARRVYVMMNIILLLTDADAFIKLCKK